MTTIPIKVTMDTAHIAQTDQMCDALVRMGMTVETTFPEIGVIFGSADPRLLPQMQALDGVSDAVPEGTLRGTGR